MSTTTTQTTTKTAAVKEENDPHHETAATIASLSSNKAKSEHTKQPDAYSTVFSTIGFGIDPSPAIENDATSAATKALYDALERGNMQLTNIGMPNLRLSVKIGVPCIDESNEVMYVDTSRLTALLPMGVPILPMQIHVGGLAIHNDHHHHGPPPALSNAVYTSVACVTLLQQQMQSHPNLTPATAGLNQLLQLQQQQQHNHQVSHESSVSVLASPTSVTASDTPLSPPTTWAEVERQMLPLNNEQEPPRGQVHGFHYPPAVQQQNALAARPDPPLLQQQLLQLHQQPTASTHKLMNGSTVPRRNTSIDMLAHISAEICDQQPENHRTTMTTTTTREKASQAEIAHDDQDAEGAAVAGENKKIKAMNTTNYNYKKLPPGRTPKNNKRLFVQHRYRDYSHERPRSDELDLFGANAPIRTPHAAFPLKLHETLKQIELDGLDHVIGWLPHGRSFKIFEQKEFVETVLPRYFVMTKKSSFLRQLNLYGFNRLSGAGPDQGSYYHEKFLRGMKFLSRRMQRQKVNGNGIRAAGNPDDEPILSRYPPCPPMALNNKKTTTSTTNKAKQEVVVYDLTTTAPAVSSSETGGGVVTNDDDVMLRSTVTAGLNVSFPLKLQRILDKLEADRNTDIISWLPHGRAFLVHDTQRFVKELMPVYFNCSKYSSFQRQLHMYNFQRITAPGLDKGAYHHDCFLRGRPHLALHMRRTRINCHGTRRPGNPDTEPDFYSQEFLPTIAAGTKIEIPTEQQHHQQQQQQQHCNSTRHRGGGGGGGGRRRCRRRKTKKVSWEDEDDDDEVVSETTCTEDEDEEEEENN